MFERTTVRERRTAVGTPQNTSGWYHSIGVASKRCNAAVPPDTSFSWHGRRGSTDGNTWDGNPGDGPR